MNAVEIVHQRHIERRRRETFFLIAAHAQIHVIRPLARCLLSELAGEPDPASLQTSSTLFLL